MIRLGIGAIFLFIGVSLISPLDDLFVLVPLSLMFGAWIFPLVWLISLICLALGIFLIGKSKLIPNPIAHHIWAFISIGVAICLYLIFTLM